MPRISHKKILLDTGILGKLCHPKKQQNRGVAEKLKKILEEGRIIVYLPEIADYELRRKLIHIALKDKKDTTKSLDRLDMLVENLDYLPLNTSTLRKAAKLWAIARYKGTPTASKEALDGDVILAAQAKEVSGVVITYNRKHISYFVQVEEWD